MRNLEVTNQVQVRLAHNRQAHKDIMMEILRGWALLKPDLFLLSHEGDVVETQRCLFNFHSRLLREIFNNESKISIPVSSRSLRSLLFLLVHGKVESEEKEILSEVKVAANLLGIDTFFLSIVENDVARVGGNDLSVNNSQNSFSALSLSEIPECIPNEAKEEEDIHVEGKEASSLNESNVTAVESLDIVQGACSAGPSVDIGESNTDNEVEVDKVPNGHVNYPKLPAGKEDKSSVFTKLLSKYTSANSTSVEDALVSETERPTKRCRDDGGLRPQESEEVISEPVGVNAKPTKKVKIQEPLPEEKVKSFKSNVKQSKTATIVESESHVNQPKESQSKKPEAQFVKPKGSSHLNFKVKKDLLKMRMRSISRTRYDRQLMTRRVVGLVNEERLQEKKSTIDRKESKKVLPRAEIPPVVDSNMESNVFVKESSAVIKKKKIVQHAVEINDNVEIINKNAQEINSSKQVSLERNQEGMSNEIDTELDSDIELNDSDIGMDNEVEFGQSLSRDFVHDMDFNLDDPGRASESEDMEETPVLCNTKNKVSLKFVDFEGGAEEIIEDIDRIKVKRNLNEEFKKPEVKVKDVNKTAEDTAANVGDAIGFQIDELDQRTPSKETQEEIGKAIAEIDRTIADIDNGTHQKKAQSLEEKIQSLARKASENNSGTATTSNSVNDGECSTDAFVVSGAIKEETDETIKEETNKSLVNVGHIKTEDGNHPSLPSSSADSLKSNSDAPMKPPATLPERSKPDASMKPPATLPEKSKPSKPSVPENPNPTNLDSEPKSAPSKAKSSSDSSGEKKFKCDKCPKSFSSKAGLSNHTIIHSGDKPFKCDQCSYSGNQKGNLKSHIKRMHGKEV